jgi:uncharacterized phage infection (PIP) family protein YhgE
MPADSTIEMRFKITDDGSVVLDKIGGKMKETTGHVEKMSGSLSLIKWDAIVNLGERAYRMGEQVWNAARQTAAWGDDIDRLSKAVGMSTDEFQKWQYVAFRADVSSEQLATGMKILARNMLQAAEGSKEQEGAFERVNVKVRDSSGNLKSYTDILGDLADEFKQMPDGPEKVAKALDIFGRSGESLLPLLDKGRAGVADLHNEFNRLGILIDKETIEKLRKADEEFERLEARLSSLGKKIMAEVVPPLSNMFAVIDQMLVIQETAGIKANLAHILELKKQRAELLAQGKSTLEIEEKIAKSRERGGFKKEPEGPGITPGEKATRPLIQSKEAANALTKALEKATEQEMKLNAYFADDAELLKQATREIERRNKAMDLMEELGIKTKVGAEREIASISEKFKLLLGQGYNPEELAAAREKLTTQLQEIAKKYKEPTGWQTEEYEGGVKWHRNVPEKGLGADVGEMVKRATAELERMQRVATEITTPKTIMIDYSPVQNANQAAEELRKKLDDLDNRVITVTIDQRITGDGIERIEEGLVTRFENKRSRLGQIIRKDIEGVIYFSNG